MDAASRIPEITRQNDNACKRIAVMVHNSVHRDARVIKGVLTLQQAGFDVTVFGLVGKNEPARTATIEGIERPVVLGTPQMKVRQTATRKRAKRLAILFNKLTRLKWLLPNAAACTIILGLSVWLASGTVQVFWLASLSMLTMFGLIALAGQIARRRQRKATKRAQKAEAARQQPFALSEVDKKRRLIRSHSEGLELAVEAQAAAQGSFDILHCHDIIALEAGRHLSNRHGWQLIWDAHELYEHLAQDDPNRSQANREVIEEAGPQVAGMITISESFADYYSREHPSLPPAAVVMNATRKAEAVLDDGRLREAAGLPESSRILLYQGGFSPFRGLYSLVEAMALVDKSWSLVMMGWGKLQEELEELATPINLTAKSRGEPARIVFLPPVAQSDLPAWTAGAALGLIPYEDICLNHTYCTPNKLWEYPNAGVPILASDLVEIRKLIETWDTGFLMPAEPSAPALAERINTIGEDEIAAKRVNCIQFRQTHHWNRFQPALLGVYDDLLKLHDAA